MIIRINRSLSKGVSLTRIYSINRLVAAVLGVIVVSVSVAYAQLSSQLVAVPELSPDQKKLEAKGFADLIRKGYIEKLDQPPRVEYVKDRMKERRAAAELKGKQHDAAELGFFSLEDSRSATSLGVQPVHVSSRALQSDSENYVFAGRDKKVLLTKTIFGAMLVDIKDVTESTLDNPNVTVGGNPGTLLHVKHQGEAWATVLYAAAGNKLFIFEADKRLEGKRKSDFLAFAEEVIASNM